MAINKLFSNSKKSKSSINIFREMAADILSPVSEEDVPLMMVLIDMLGDIPVIRLNGKRYSDEEYQDYKRYHPTTDFHEIRIEEMVYPEGWEQEYAARKANELLAQEALQATAKAAKDNPVTDTRKEELTAQDADIKRAAVVQQLRERREQEERDMINNNPRYVPLDEKPNDFDSLIRNINYGI